MEVNIVESETLQEQPQESLPSEEQEPQPTEAVNEGEQQEA